MHTYIYTMEDGSFISVLAENHTESIKKLREISQSMVLEMERFDTQQGPWAA